jgi:hypothetical protein
MHNRDADALHVKLLQAREQRRARGRLSFDDDRRRETAFDFVDELFCVVGLRRYKLDRCA